MLRALVLFATLVLFAGHAAAEEPASVRLLPGWHDEAGVHVAAVEITLAPGWHTYWRVPGAAGIPPRFDWGASRNLAGARVEWPHPEVFDSFGMRTIGYQGGVVLPILLTPRRAGAPVELDLTLHFGVCKDICIPAEGRVTGTLGPAPPAAALGNGRAAIEAALARRAHRPAEAGVIDATCRIAPNGHGHDLTATVRLQAPPARDQITVIEAVARPDLWISEATARTDGAVVTAEARLKSPGDRAPCWSGARCG
jgi:DsbC/DsbD-like thiol-disulfide interchange protein